MLVQWTVQDAERLKGSERMKISKEKGGEDVLFGVGDSEGLEGRKKVRNRGREGREEAVAPTFVQFVILSV
jgi:hypothetical protein